MNNSVYNPSNYSITNSNVLFARLPIPDSYKPKEGDSVIITAEEKISRSKILGTIFQFYSGVLKNSEGLSSEKMLWDVPLVVQKVDTEEYILVRKTATIGYGGLDILIDEDFQYIYIALENKEGNTIILGTATKEVGEQLFDRYRKSKVVDLDKDNKIMTELSNAISEAKKAELEKLKNLNKTTGNGTILLNT